MWDYITLNPKDIGYHYPDVETGEYLISDTVYTVNKKHIESNDIGISKPIKLGELYKYQLEQELLEQIKKLENILKKEEF